MKYSKVSACQPVSEEISSQVRGSGQEEELGELPFRGSDEETVVWPAQIAKVERFPLRSRHRSFCYVRQATGSTGMREKKVKVENHVLIVVEHGRVLIERDDYRELIEAGHAVIISDTEVRITELPQPGGSATRCFYYFFNDTILGHVIAVHPRVAGVLYCARDYPLPHNVIPVRQNLFQAVHAEGRVPAPEILIPMLRCVMNSCSLAFFKVCLKRIVYPRLRIQIFLENLILHPRKNFDVILQKYPGGIKQLRREMYRLHMPSVSALVLQRREHLYFLWHCRGHLPEKQVFDVFHERCPRVIAKYRRLKEDFAAMRMDRMFEELCTDPVGLSVFGLISALTRSRQNDEFEKTFKTGAVIDMNSLTRESASPDDPVDRLRTESPEFWEMKNTGIKRFIETEKLTEIEELADCQELLLAA